MILPGCAAALLLAASPPAAEQRTLVSVSFGGGSPRTWDVRLVLTGAEARVDWSYPQDLEGGDQLVPGPGFLAQAHDYGAAHLGAQDPAAPPHSARLRGTTEGDGDGLFLEVVGDLASTALRVEGCGEGGALPLRDLVAQAAVLPVGDSHLVVRAFDLAAVAPLRKPHADTQAHPVILHAHSCFSTSTMSLEEQRKALLPFVRTVWWTDHNPGNQRNILCGDFEDRPLSRWYWDNHQGGEIKVERRRILADEERSLVYVVQARSTGAGPGIARTFCPGFGVGNIYLGLALQPRLSFAWKTAAHPGAVAYVNVRLNSGRAVRYLSAPLPELLPGRDLVLPTEAGRWVEHTRDLRADLAELQPDAGTDGVMDVTFGVILTGGVPSVEFRFDDLRLETPEPEEWIRRQEASYQGDPQVVSYMGMEQSSWDSARDQGGLTPHITLLPPDHPESCLHSFSAEPSAADRAATVAAVQDAGGVAGAHHLQDDEAYQFLHDHAEVGLDLFEVGAGWRSVPRYANPAERARRDDHAYPSLPADELHPLLVRYDAALQRGLLLTLYGAPDLHDAFHRSFEGWFNRWVTSIYSDQASPDALLRELRRGQAIARDFQSTAELDLVVDGRPWMGRQVVTDRPSQVVTVRLEGALAGSRIRWIQGVLDREVADASFQEQPGPVRVSEAPIGDAPPTLVVDTTQARFVRAELLGPSGALEALTNPILFLPYWPEEFGTGRVAFDVGGVVLGEDTGLWVTDARMEGARLVLRGRVLEATHRLSIHGPSPPRPDPGGPGVQGWDAARETWSVHDLPPGPFELTVAFDADLPALPRADPRNVPPRKRQDFRLDVTLATPEVEARLLGGLTEPYTPDNSTPEFCRRHTPGFRGFQGDQAVIRLPLPTGRECWVKVEAPRSVPVPVTLLLGERVLDRVASHDQLVFHVPPIGGDGEVVETTLTLRLEEPLPPLSVRLSALQVLSGPGVLDY